MVSEMRKDNERRDYEMKEVSLLNNTLKSKLEESQKSLESNAQMISWLNKQLNEKPGIGGGMMPQSSYKMSTTIGNSLPSGMNRPPVSTQSSFKPTFASIEQLNGSSSGAGASTFERSPFRNLQSSSHLLNTPSSVMSSTSSISNSFIATTNPINLNNQATGLKPAFSYAPGTTNNLIKINNENVSTNLPLAQPSFVSKYTQ